MKWMRVIKESVVRSTKAFVKAPLTRGVFKNAVLILIVAGVCFAAGGEFIPQLHTRQLTVKDSASFAGASVSFTSATVTGLAVSSGGTADFTYVGVSAGASINGGLTVDEISVTGVATANTVEAVTGFIIGDVTGAPQISLRSAYNIVATGSTTSEVIGDSLTIPAGWLDADEAIDIMCYGLISGVSTKTATLYAGATATGTVDFYDDNDGYAKIHFLMFEHTDAAHQGTVVDTMISAGTTLVQVPNAVATTVNMAQSKKLAVKISTPDVTSDEFTLLGCIWTFMP